MTSDKTAPLPRQAGASMAAPETMPENWPQPPSLALDGLFAAIGRSGIFSDAKIAADMNPNRPPEEILAAWKEQRDESGFSLKTFVSTWFTVPPVVSAAYQRRPGENVEDYIAGMWDVLTHQADTPAPWSSLLALPEKYVVPGGRFTELYYWDTYFTLIGLYEGNRIELMRATFRNLASLIDRYGHIPNGSRTYYLSRSQPAFFALMVDLVAQHDGSDTYVRYLPQLEKEYEYWNDGAAALKPGHVWRHAVRLSDGALLVRPWDDLALPRDESFPEDIRTAAESNRPASEVWRDLRAGSETGWDFSSRWLLDRRALSSIHATDLATIEMSCAVAHLARTLAHAYDLTGDKARAAHYRAEASQRVLAIQRVLWDPRRGAFYDYDWKRRRHTDVLSAATAAPLFFHMATGGQARQVAKTLRGKLLHPGGLAATDITSGQQWDAPNGWAPLQWMAIKGLSLYGEDALATEIASRWMRRVIGTYEKSGVLLEKYDVVSPRITAMGGTGGGEYPMQIGFGWTNGTLLAMIHRYPQLAQQILSENPLAGQETQMITSPETGETTRPVIPLTTKNGIRPVIPRADHD